MIFGNPVRGAIVTRLTAGRFYRSQRFGCTGFTWEPRLGSCLHFHRGIDIAFGGDACGKDVLAAAPGTVIFAGQFNDGTNAIVIRHAGGWATGYYHCRHLVSKGQKVAGGQHIGEMDQSGPATGCHCHFAVKNDFPTSAGVNEFAQDDPKYGKSGIGSGGKGTWVDPWPQLAQNVTVHPKLAPIGIRIRTAPDLTSGSIYATTEADGRIHRQSDNADLGETPQARPWGGTVTGAFYSVGNSSSNRWDRMFLGGAYRYVAMLLAQRSAS